MSRFSLAALAAVALRGAPTVAQEPARAQAIQAYGGELFRDRLTVTPVSGRTQYRIVGSPIEGEAYAQPVGITPGNGVTANLGIATKSYVTTNLFWDLGIRYWYLDRVVSLEDALLTTAGAGAA